MAFGKAIAAEPLNLLEAPFRELSVVAAAGHPLDHLGLEILHLSQIAERRHRAAQLVRFARGELRRDDRQLHRLFLEQRDAVGLAQQQLQFIRRAMLGRG